MAKPVSPPKMQRPAAPLPRRKGIGLRWRIAAALTGLIFLLGLPALGVVGLLMIQILRAQLDQRAAAIATNLSDAATSYVVAKRSLELNALVSKYALLDGVAYVFVRDGKNHILAHSLGAFPGALRENLPFGGREAQQRVVTFEDKEVYETSAPILEGQAGTAHVGIWGNAVQEVIRQAVLPLIALLGLALLLGLFFSLLLTHRIVRPIVRLTRAAERMSKGDLESPIGVASRDEIGELALSLERMRASLKAAMLRLRHHPNGGNATAGEAKENGQPPAGEKPLVLPGVLILGAFLALSPAGAAAEKAAERPPAKIVIAYSALSGSQLPAWIAYEAGLFRKHGLDAQLIFIESGSRAVQTLITGDVALAQVAGSSVIESNLHGSDAVMIAGFVNTMDYQFIVARNITQPEQLRGKSVAVSRFGSSSDFATRYALEKYGLKPNKDVALVQIGSQPARFAALESGQIQGVMVAVPLTLQARKMGFNVLADLKLLGLEYQHTGLAATRSWLKEHPELAESAVQAFVEAIYYMKSHRRESVEVLAKYLKNNSADALEETYAAIGINLIPDKPYPTTRGIQIMLREMAARDPKAERAKPEQFVDATFIRELDSSGAMERLRKAATVVASQPEKSIAPAPASEVQSKVSKALAATTAKPAPPAAVRTIEYTVKSGDTLSRVAERYYGSVYQWKRIYSANARTVKSPNTIYAGQKLVIPPADGSR